MKKGMKRIVFEIDEQVHEMIRIKAIQKKTTLKVLLTQVVNRWLKRE